MAKNPNPNLKGEDQVDAAPVLPKKKTGSKPSNKPMSPIMQVMQAVTKAATTPGKKKKSPVKAGPSKANLKTPQKQGRTDKSDGLDGDGDND